MLEDVFAAALAVAVVAAGACLGVAATGRLRSHPLALVAGSIGVVAVAAWVAAALRPSRELALTAAGLTVAAAAVAGAAALTRAVRRSRATDRALNDARARITVALREEAAQHGAELQQWVARMRADSVSALEVEERRLAEERRRELEAREQAVRDGLAETFAAVEQRLEERLRGWSHDLERAQSSLGVQLTRLEQRQQQLIAEAEARIEAEASELVTTSEEQRAAVLRLREELERSAQAAVAEALDELQAHTTERRRVIEEIAERLRQREQTLKEQVERAESEAMTRIELTFGDVERRQLEKLKRSVSREAERFSEAAGQQFEGALKGAREEAAARLSRELDRAVDAFVRQSDQVFAERLNQVGDSAQQRLEMRLRQAQSHFDRQREELEEAFARRVADAESDLRRTLGALVAEAEAERAGLEGRLAELSRRVEEAAAGFGRRR